MLVWSSRILTTTQLSAIIRDCDFWVVRSPPSLPLTTDYWELVASPNGNDCQWEWDETQSPLVVELRINIMVMSTNCHHWESLRRRRGVALTRVSLHHLHLHHLLHYWHWEWWSWHCCYYYKCVVLLVLSTQHDHYESCCVLGSSSSETPQTPPMMPMRI